MTNDVATLFGWRRALKTLLFSYIILPLKSLFPRRQPRQLSAELALSLFRAARPIIPCDSLLRNVQFSLLRDVVTCYLVSSVQTDRQLHTLHPESGFVELTGPARNGLVSRLLFFYFGTREKKGIFFLVLCPPMFTFSSSFVLPFHILCHFFRCSSPPTVFFLLFCHFSLLPLATGLGFLLHLSAVYFNDAVSMSCYINE